MNGLFWKPLPVWQMLLLLAAPLLVYANALSAGFVYDDVSITVLQNPFLHGEVSGWDVLFWDRPLREFTYGFDHAIWGWKPFGYHLQNIVWHTANVYLVLILLTQLGCTSSTAFWCAVLFAVHPINTEAVTWISGRKDVLCLFFELLACILFLRAYQFKKMQWLYTASLLSFGLALLSKQVAVVLPGLLVLCVLFSTCQDQKKFDWITILRWVAPFVFVLLASLLFYFDILNVLGIVQERGTFYDPSAANTGYTFLSAILTPFVTWLKSWQLLWFPLDLVIDRELPPAADLLDWRWIAGFILVCGLFGTALVMRTSYPALGFGLMWFALAWFPLSGVIPIGYVLADRYLYIPCVGFCVFFVVMAQFVLSKHKLVLAFMSFLLIAMSTRTVIRNMDWQNEQRLWESVLTYYPDQPSVYFNLGNSFWDQNQMEQAYAQWHKALELDSEYEGVWLNMGIAKKDEGDLDTAKQYFLNALSANPQYGTAHYNLAKLFEEQGDTRSAIQHYQHASRYLFGKRNAAQLQALACYHAARLLHQTQNAEQALAYIKRGLSLSQHHAPSWVLYGMLSEQHPDTAKTAFLQAIAISPEYSAAHYNLGVLEWMQGNPEQAQHHWDTAIALDPAIKTQIDTIKSE